ncbi:MULTISPECIES: hypothetical protein [Arthrobacter]|uniref:Prephenate dehydratase n=1 Tax=Arthrobacter terricola TaxID=2547396 RepID=A0A4R5K9F4_9MICC|nr:MULTISPECIES: hypothetical protein [Arthrobacter]MBT8163011.1 hypothetical protein [Arthrobacter sp. GN70]TDF91783.1 hypothetical protein E1809_19895 [Arthrobacter terricola]
MRPDIQLHSMPLATLGPAGTDAFAVAEQLTLNVIACDTFPEAMKVAEESRIPALICAGYREMDRSGFVTDDWSHLHFRYRNSMRVTHVWTQPTKPMCLAVRDGITYPEQVSSVALHPATSAIANDVLPSADQIAFRSKPAAVQAANTGQADACIGSVDVITEAGNLHIVEYFSTEMIWCLYEHLR